MEFFSVEIREPDEDVLKMFSSIGSQIGQFVQRKRAEEALQKSKESLEQLVRQRTKALRVVNAELKNQIERRKGLEGEILSVSDREQQRLGQELHGIANGKRQISHSFFAWQTDDRGRNRQRSRRPRANREAN